MSITVKCNECRAVMQDGLMEHADLCSATVLANEIAVDYYAPPTMTIEFATMLDRDIFFSNFKTTGSDLVEPDSKPEQTDTKSALKGHSNAK